jgi:predicted small lipoprotein YifL
MKAKTLILSMALAGLALGGCGRLGELERPGAEPPRSGSNDTVMDPSVDGRTARDAPIPGSNPK